MSTSTRLPRETVDLRSSSTPQNTMLNSITPSPQHNTTSLERASEKVCNFHFPQNTKSRPQVNGIIGPTKFSQAPHTILPHSAQPQPAMAFQDNPAANTPQEHRPLIIQHQDPNKVQSEQITDLRIKVAVLENELLHAQRDKEAVEKSLGIVIESLTRFSTAAVPSYQLKNGDTKPNIRDFEKEIERLRRENRHLRRREQELGYQVAMKNLLGEEEQLVDVLGDGLGVGAEREKDKGKEREMNGRTYEVSFHNAEHAGPTPEQLAGSWANPGPTPEQLAGSWANSDPSFQHGKGNVLTSRDLIGSWGNPAAEFGEAGPSNANNSFGSGSTTVPNTPVLNATSFESSFADVGLHTLEENMDMESDGFPPAPSFPPSNPQTGEEEEKDIDEQLPDQEAALQKFNAIPKPGVLNVGFTVEGTKRGDDYDAHPLQPTSSNYPPTFQRQHTMKDYDRFGTQPPTGPCSFNSSPSLDLKIPGDLSGDQDLWSSSQQRKDAVEIHMRSTSPRSRDAELKFPEFFRYGITYLPSVSDSNYLRTVMLTNLPLDTEVRDILNRVRGGEVLSASLLDTSTITGNMTARIVFRHQEAAEGYTAYCNSHPLLFPSSSSPDQQVIATHLQTPTFPLSSCPLSSCHLSRLAHSQTRCLSIPNFPPSLSLTTLERHLSSNNGVRGAMLSELFIDEDCTLHLQFSDVFWAGAAYGILTNFQMYRGLEVLFSADPCAGPVGELSLPVAPRPPMLPNNWAELQKRAMGNDGKEVVKMAEEGQRKRLVALQNQKVEIPTFDGKEIQGGSWADEVIDELEGDEPAVLSEREVQEGCVGEKEDGDGRVAPPNSPMNDGEGGEGDLEGERGIDALLREKGNGLSASRFAPRSPFSSTTVQFRASSMLVDIEESPTSNELAITDGNQLSTTTYQAKRVNKSPPKVNLSSLLASPTSSTSSNFESNHINTIREPRGPEHDLGFRSGRKEKIESYDTAEEERDEVNLGMSDGLLVGAVGEGGEGVVRNEDEILLESEDDEVVVDGR